jgi:hypothetical protein
MLPRLRVVKGLANVSLVAVFEITAPALAAINHLLCPYNAVDAVAIIAKNNPDFEFILRKVTF